MRRWQQGWTLVEVLVSAAILTVLLALMGQALAAAQWSWLFARKALEMTRTIDDAQLLLSRRLREATLQPRQSYDTATDTLVPDSDLHFACGPAVDLMPAVSAVSGDAIFFQHSANDGSLQNALQSCGFFVQFGDEENWRPGFLSAAARRQRFRLLHFHQPAGSFPLFQNSGVAGAPPPLSEFKTRPDLYAWFAAPLSNTDGIGERISVVAENVVAMFVRAMPGETRCYDTRRHQWEGGTEAAMLTRHQLPRMVEITLVMTDEASWSRLSPSGAEALAREVLALPGTGPSDSSPPNSRIAALGALLESHRMASRLAIMTLPIAERSD